MSAKVAPVARHDLRSSAANVLLSRTYPRSDVRLELNVRWRQPGTVVDTVGIVGARPGSFAISVLPHGHVTAQIYDPARQSPVRRADGWHVLTSKRATLREATSSIVLELFRGDVALWVNGRLESRVRLPTPLSGEAAWLGNFPGDDGMGPHTYAGMTGSVHVAYFGALEPNAYVAERKPEVKL